METLLQVKNSCLCLTGQYESVCCGALSAVIMEGDLYRGSEACPVGSDGNHAVSEVDCKTIPGFSWWTPVASWWFRLLSWI